MKLTPGSREPALEGRGRSQRTAHSGSIRQRGEVRGAGGKEGALGNMAAGVGHEPGLCVDSWHITTLEPMALDRSPLMPLSYQVSLGQAFQKEERKLQGVWVIFSMLVPLLGHISMSKLSHSYELVLTANLSHSRIIWEERDCLDEVRYVCGGLS